MKKISFFFALLLFTTLLTACQVENYDTKKEKDVDFTVVSEQEELPQMKEMIEQSKKEPFRKTYSDGDYLYLMIGYGAQPTSSFSIEIQELYESSNAIYITSMLKGPSKTETVLDVETYPYIVVKVPYSDKAVVFQ